MNCGACTVVHTFLSGVVCLPQVSGVCPTTTPPGCSFPPCPCRALLTAVSYNNASFSQTLGGPHSCVLLDLDRNRNRDRDRDRDENDGTPLLLLLLLAALCR